MAWKCFQNFNNNFYIKFGVQVEALSTLWKHLSGKLLGNQLTSITFPFLKVKASKGIHQICIEKSPDRSYPP